MTDRYEWKKDEQIEINADKSRIIKNIVGDNTAWENALNDYKKKTKADFERNPEKTRKNVRSSSYFFVEYLVPQKNADED